MAHAPLDDEVLDAAIFSLPLVGANFVDYLNKGGAPHTQARWVPLHRRGDLTLHRPRPIRRRFKDSCTASFPLKIGGISCISER